MPNVPLMDDFGQLDQFAPAILSSFMLFPTPDGREHREAYLAKHVAEYVLNLKVPPESPITIDRHFLSNLLNAPSRKEITRLAERHSIGGSLSGTLLYFIVALHQHRPLDASLLKAVEIYVTFLEKSENAGKVSKSPAFIKEQWGIYRHVSHFWAASHTLRQHVENFDHEEAPKGLFLDFLALSEWFRSEGETIIARGQAHRHGPVLDPSRTYRVPPELDLPSMSADLPNLSPDVLDILKSYRAPKRI